MSEEKVMSASEKKKEDWMNSKWRPMMGWMYMLVCTADFVIFPVLWSLVQAMHGGRVETQWSPITLNGAGLFHMAMGAILGIAAFGRTQEKIAGANNNNTGFAMNGSMNGNTNSYQSSGMNSYSSRPYSPSQSYDQPIQTAYNTAPAPVMISSTGKAMPAPQIDPPL